MVVGKPITLCFSNAEQGNAFLGPVGSIHPLPGLLSPGLNHKIHLRPDRVDTSLAN